MSTDLTEIAANAIAQDEGYSFVYPELKERAKVILSALEPHIIRRDELFALLEARVATLTELADERDWYGLPHPDRVRSRADAIFLLCEELRGDGR